MAILYILGSLCIFVFFELSKYFAVFWYISPGFGMMFQEKSGNPEQQISE
jgi:hypothetical protein